MTLEEQAQVDQLNADLQKAQENLTASEAKNSELQTQLSEAQAQLSEAKGQLTDAQEKLNESEKKSIDAQAELNLLKNASTGEEVETLKKQLDDFKEANVNLTSQVEQLSKQAGQWGIKNLEEAQAHVSEKYKVPASVKRIMVTQDGNVFYDGDINSGIVHAKDKGILSFSFQNFQ